MELVSGRRVVGSLNTWRVAMIEKKRGQDQRGRHDRDLDPQRDLQLAVAPSILAAS